MKTSKKTFIFFLLAGLMVSSCGKNNNSGSPDGWNVGGGYDIIGGNNGGNTGSQQAFEAARQWFNNENVNSAHLLLSQVFVRRQFNQTSANNNCNTSSWWIFDWTTCSGSSSNGSATNVKYTCVYSNTNNNNSGHYSLGYREVTNPNNCYQPNVTATLYDKNSNQELRKVLSLNNNQWALYEARNENGLISISVGPKVNGNIFNPTPTHFYQIDTRIHSIYNPVFVQDTVNRTYNVIQHLY